MVAPEPEFTALQISVSEKLGSNTEVVISGYLVAVTVAVSHAVL